jgi:hypothetical protein
MLLSPGTKLGPYEILGPIGAGGMGEVYRAGDSQLQRNVAIKVLPSAFADGADRMARFQREALVLNHPISRRSMDRAVGDGDGIGGGEKSRRAGSGG